VVFPEEALAAHLTHVTTHFRVHAVRVCAQVCAIKEPLMTDVTVEFVRPKVQPFVLQVAGAREEELAADVTRFVWRQFRFDAASDVGNVRLVIVIDAATHARECAVTVVVINCHQAGVAVTATYCQV